MRQTPHFPNLVSESQSVGDNEERVLVAGVEVCAGVEVWEGDGQVTERAVEGEGAVGKRVGGVVVGHIDFADVEAREDREERGRRGGCLAVVPSEMLESGEVRREKRREEVRPEPCSSPAEAFCMKNIDRE